MQSILRELFYGNINPNAKQFVRNSEYGKAFKTVSDCEEKLNVLLSGKELELFEKLMKAQSESSFISGREYTVCLQMPQGGKGLKHCDAAVGITPQEGNPTAPTQQRIKAKPPNTHSKVTVANRA